MSDLIEPHVRYIRARGFSKRTQADRRRLLHRADRDLPLGLEQATCDELADFLARYDDNQTKATYHGHLKGFYDWATAHEHLDWNPMETIPRPRVRPGVPHPVTDPEFEQIFTAARNPFRLWLLLAAYAGLRPVEIAALDRADVTEKTITIRCGKGSKPAVLPTHPEIWTAVKDLPAGRVARNTLGGPVTASAISKKIGKHLKRLGIPGAGCRRLRHWFATTTLHETKNLRIVQELMRHSSPATTAVYTQVTSEERQMAIAALPALAPTSA